MANSFIKPQAADLVGLTTDFSGLGQDVKNSNVVAAHFSYAWSNDLLIFDALYFYNNVHRNAYFANQNTAPPCKTESYTISGIDLNKPLVDQCLDQLLTLPQFNGSQPSTLVWVKS